MVPPILYQPQQHCQQAHQPQAHPYNLRSVCIYYKLRRQMLHLNTESSHVIVTLMILLLFRSSPFNSAAAIWFAFEGGGGVTRFQTNFKSSK